MKNSIRKKYARIVKNEALQLMLYLYGISTKDWKSSSILNPRFSKGKMWNVLAANFDVRKTYCYKFKYNLLKEYESCLIIGPELGIIIYEDSIKNKRKGENKEKIVPYYEEPNFQNYKDFKL